MYIPTTYNSVKQNQGKKKNCHLKYTKRGDSFKKIFKREEHLCYRKNLLILTYMLVPPVTDHSILPPFLQQ